MNGGKKGVGKLSSGKMYINYEFQVYRINNYDIITCKHVYSTDIIFFYRTFLKREVASNSNVT